ncbi:hypothetical protein [Paraburkholderia adhaesiva]|uniref:hypothetical protein n=1 Tax=Paraburkholderia adhaesiva TaxID=2883244 RepID=UPI001F42C167|nr:hypothetical protein [Paraburkholderia adhaesiva]
MAATITGGAKLEAVLRVATAKLAAAGTLEVGFMSEATEADNTPVVEVATVNEFGGTVNVPAHETTVYRSLGRAGDLLRGGRFVKAKQSNFATTHEVPAYTVTIPPRPFFRSMVAKES